MATRSPYPGESSTREVSPFFSLPNEDGSNPHQEYYADQSLQQQQYPPITLSCAQCERIIGDSSSFLFVTRQMGTVTLDRVVSVAVGLGGLKTSSEGEWDEFCNYKDISCGKCTATLGKMYFATTSKLLALQNRNTLCIAALSFYHHGSDAPSLPIAATSEIYAQLNPSPEALTESIERVETVCVVLREEQSIIIRELKKLGAAIRIDVDLEDETNGERLYVRGSWKEQTQVPDGEGGGGGGRGGGSDRVDSTAQTKTKPGNKGREKDRKVAGRLELGEELIPEEQKSKGKLGTRAGSVVAREIQTAPRRQGMGSQRAPPTPPLPPAAANKRKRKSVAEINVAPTAGKQAEHVDFFGGYDDHSTPPKPRFWRSLQQEVPNSQSAGEEEAHVEPGTERRGFGSYQEYEVIEETTEEEEEEEVEEEERIRSPVEKKRREVTPVLRKEVLMKKGLHHKKGHK